MATDPALVAWLQDTMNPDQNARKEAEMALINMETRPDFVSAMISLLCCTSVAREVRIAAAIALKNCVRKRWAPDGQSGLQALSDEARSFLKSNVLPAMLQSDSVSRRQMSETICLISKHDFPDQWPELLPTLKSYFDSQDYSVIHSALETANCLFKRYQKELRSNELWGEIKYVLDNFAETLTEVMKKLLDNVVIQITGQINVDCTSLNGAIECLIQVAEIFYSLNVQDLPEFFEDHMLVWMNAFLSQLTIDVGDKFKMGANDEPTSLDRLRTQICDNLTLYAQSYDEEFKPYASRFIEVVLFLMMEVNILEPWDSLFINGVHFLSAVSLRCYCVETFSKPDVIKGACLAVVIRNMQLRPSDMELFESSPDEYAEQDLGGSDLDTRRRAASDFVKALCKFFESEVVAIFSEYINSLLKSYFENPRSTWMQLNAAVSLVIVLGARGQTSKFGVTRVSEFFNVGDFYNTFLKSGLQDDNSIALFKADVLKYLIAFRNQVHKDIMIEVLPRVVRFLVDECPVVRIYSANLIDHMLQLRDPSNAKEALFAKSEFEPYIGTIITHLSRALTMEETTECSYTIRCLMQVLHVFCEQPADIVSTLSQQLCQKIALVAKNPRKPHFNHYLFETACLLVKSMERKNMDYFRAIESMLMEPFQDVLQTDVSDFVPYVFQVLSLMLNMRVGKGEGIPEAYMALYPFILQPCLWERRGYVPALVRLLEAYLRLSYKQEVSADTFGSIIPIFSRLVNIRSAEQDGMELISTAAEWVAYPFFEPHYKTVLTVLFTRLQAMKTERFAGLFATFFCQLLAVHKLDDVINHVEAIQQNLFGVVLQKLIIPQLSRIPSKPLHRRWRVLGLTALVVDCNLVTKGSLRSIWVPLVESTVALTVKGASNDEEEHHQEENLLGQKIEIANQKEGVDSVYSLLVHSKIPIAHPVACGPVNLGTVVSNALCRFHREQPDVMAGLVAIGDGELQAKLEEFIKERH
uniref:Exportin-2 n=1 Tax=Trichuris muris TaxID=70415 RepID=A0A5S6QFA0_TRIMR